MTSIHQHVADARGRLRDAGIRSAELDARLLAEFALGWNTERFVVSARTRLHATFLPGTTPSSVGVSPANRWLHIVGHREFWGLSLAVSPAVLIPRPETELIVHAALDLFPDRERTLAVADVCTGCGCVAIALAAERPAAHIFATDISEPALEVARQNGVSHGVADRITFVRTDLLDGMEGPFDLITCNPPYVAEVSRPGLQPEVREHEPAVALFGGADGLGIVARLVADAGRHLRPGGYLLFEFGYGQDEEVARRLIRGAADAARVPRAIFRASRERPSFDGTIA